MLNGAAEMPPTTSTFTGTATLGLAADGTLTVAVSTSVPFAQATMAHIHDVNANGAPICTLTLANAGGNTSASATCPLDQAQLSDLNSGKLYVNVHTMANPGGDIAGFIMQGAPPPPPTPAPTASTPYNATLNGATESPPTTSVYTGVANIALAADGRTLTVNTITTIPFAQATMAHVHDANAQGAPICTLTLANGSGNASAAGVCTLTTAYVSDLNGGKLYVNVHTMANPGGDIAGFILSGGGAAQPFSATLNGASATPPTTSANTGTAQISLAAGGTMLTVMLSSDVPFAQATMAHVHDANMGGAPICPLTLANSGGVTSASGTCALNAVELADLFAGKLYVNVHTQANPAGEIAGSIVWGSAPMMRTYHAVLNAATENPPTSSTHTGTASATLDGMVLTVAVTTDIPSQRATAAHVHDANETGSPPICTLMLRDVNGSASADGTCPLSQTQLADLDAGRLYINVHTLSYPDGAIAGYLLP
jgi:hypothetical protein